MDPRFTQPVSREQIVAIIRQRAERNLDQAAAAGPPPIPPAPGGNVPIPILAPPRPMDPAAIMAIIRQRAERNLDQAAIAPGAPPPIPPAPGGYILVAPPRPMDHAGAAQPPQIGILPPPPPPPPLQQQPGVVVPRGIIVDQLIRPSPPSPPPPPPAAAAAAGGGIGLYARLHDIGGRRLRRNEHMQRPSLHNPLYRQVSVTSSASDDEHCISAYSESVLDVPRCQNVNIESTRDGDIITYSSGPGDDKAVGGYDDDESGGGWQQARGVYIGCRPIQPDGRVSFEIEILERGKGALGINGGGGLSNGITVGICSGRHPVDVSPGWAPESVAFRAGDGTIFKGRPWGQAGFGPRCDVGDKIGIGIRTGKSTRLTAGDQGGEASSVSSYPSSSLVYIFFTCNGKEFGSLAVNYDIASSNGYFPIIGVLEPGEEVCLKMRCHPSPDEDMMLVDGGEDEWLRLHDIRINGQILEYTGRGKSNDDVGLAQAKNPICTRHHYFEIEIVDPGVSCYIAIGLARKDYPRNRHPGWNKGSIAYHADDGKVFLGSGVGAHFGPRCHKGDIMGCGILFPKSYQCKSDSDEELEQQGGGHRLVDLEAGAAATEPVAAVGVAEAVISVGGQHQGGERRPDIAAVCVGRDADLPSEEDNIRADDLLSDSEEDWWNDQAPQETGVKVQIFFTRNSKVIGKKDTTIPRGGFFPTVGMMSCQERVRVDLRPLSG